MTSHTTSRSEHNERFVAFAFAASDMVVETDDAGLIAFASGAFPSRFGRPAEAFVGSNVLEMVSLVDRGAAQAALLAAIGCGRALPTVVRLADGGRTSRALAGLALPGTKPIRVCLTFSPLPQSVAEMPRMTVGALSRTVLDGDAGGTLRLVEVRAEGAELARVNDAVVDVLGRMFPQVLATELSPGRFSMSGGGLEDVAPGAMSESLLASLNARGIAAKVADHVLDIGRGDLTDVQVALTLRRALDAFARDGLAGLGASGLSEGLEAYLRKAEIQTAVLRRAIRDQSFTMAYQPICWLESRKTHHLEALIRPPPHASYKGPQEFVSVAETLNLAGLLDLAVAEAVCEAALEAPAPVAFNVSAQSLSDGGFGERLLTLLRRSPAVQQGRVLVEMTETVVAHDQGQVQAVVRELRDLSVAFCIDDFGAGSADVQMLRWLPSDYVKLDRSYVREVAADDRSRALAGGLVELARRSGAQMIAEGVETEVQRATLMAMQVPLGQGWLFGKPGPLAPVDTGAGRRRGAREQWG